MKIGIIGNYGAANVGDDAILAAILKSLGSDHEITVFSAHPKRTEFQFHVKTAPLFPLGFRSFFKRGFGQSRKALAEVDAVIFGGGGLFQDNRLYACFLWAWQLFWVYFYEKPLFIYATGVGPLRTWIGRKLTAWAYRHAQVITVRDEISRSQLRRIGLDTSKIHVSGDPAFLFRPSEIAPERHKNLIAVSLRPWLKYNRLITKTFIDFLRKLKEEKGAKFLFIAMQEINERDRKLIDPILKEVGGELIIPRDFSELLQIMQRVEFAIGMRYHFCVAALLTQTPLLPVSYSPKVDSLFEDTPLEKYLIHVADIGVEALTRLLIRLSVDYNNVKVYERTRTHILREASESTLNLFHRFLDELKTI